MIQKTIKNRIEFSGIGLHTGCEVRVRILPSAPDTGITFVRTDVPGSPVIDAAASSVVRTSYATTLGSGGVTVSTVEHLMAAFYGMGVDNAIVELDGPEIPVLDGSSAEFVEMLEEAGLTHLDSPRKYLVVREPVKVEDGGRHVMLLPSDEMDLTIDYSIDFSHPFLSRQKFSDRFSSEVFTTEVGRARTFGFLRDVETLRANGLAKGGSLSNAVVIGENEILNEGGLRYPDEFVRHKVLDLIGDLSLVGCRLVGRIVAHRSGHELNNRLVRELILRPDAWDLVDGFSVEEPAEPAPVYAGKLATL